MPGWKQACPKSDACWSPGHARDRHLDAEAATSRSSPTTPLDGRIDGSTDSGIVELAQQVRVPGARFARL